MNLEKKKKIEERNSEAAPRKSQRLKKLLTPLPGGKKGEF